MSKAAAEPEKPICYLRMRNGKPDWAEDCVSTSVSEAMAGYEQEDGYSTIPLYASPSAQPIARDEQDAKRYRWLRQCGCDQEDTLRMPGSKYLCEGSALDARVDAAMYGTALKSAGKE